MDSGRTDSGSGLPGTNSSDSRRADIQGLRAVAVLMVLAFHAGLPVPGGFVGVDVFFVISGFVITGMLNREWADTHRIDFRTFYLRRFKRLTPALALMIVVVLLLSGLILSPLGTQQTAALTAIGAMALVANVVIAHTTGGYFDAPAETNPLLNTWSLSVEEQFYLAFPALVALGWAVARDGGRARRAFPFILVGVTTAASFLLAVLGSSGGQSTGTPWLVGFFSAFTRAWEFAAGALLALLVQSRDVRTSAGGVAALGMLGSAMLVASLWAIHGNVPYPGFWTLLPVTGTLLVILAGTGNASPVTRVLATRPMVRIGDLSYSLYLWHWPLIAFAGLLWPGHPAALLLAAAVAGLPALASYRWVELPIRELPGLGLVKTTALVLGTVAIPIVMAVGVAQAASRLWIPLMRGVQGDALAAPDGYAMGCHFGPESSGAPGVCRWNEGSLGEPVYLVGDSNAAHYTEGLRSATARTSRTLAVSTSSSCPLLTGITLVFADRADYGELCREYVDATMSWLAAARPGVVVLSASDGYWLDSATGVSMAAGTMATEPAAKVALLRRALDETVMRLTDAGHSVVLVQTLPHWADGWNLASCTLIATLSGCTQTMPVATSRARSEPVRSAVRQVGRKTGSRVVDLGDAVCPQEVCLSWREDRWVYRDASHITNAASRGLASNFVDILLPRADRG